MPEQADAYVGTAAFGQFDMKKVQSLFLRVDEGCASVPVTALVSSDGISTQLIHSSKPSAIVRITCASIEQAEQQRIGGDGDGTCHSQKDG